MRHALAKEVARLLLLEASPMERARQAKRIMLALDEYMQAFHAIRGTAVQELHENYGFTVQDVAEELGVSWTRAKQLVTN